MRTSWTGSGRHADGSEDPPLVLQADSVPNPSKELPGSMGGTIAMLEVEELLEEVEMAPVDIAKVLTRWDADGEGTDIAMNEVVEEMHKKSRSSPEQQK
ncbi:hypothetical protein ZIOFF_056377 [Zingiber officinale]|uniref:Uncharacterized protein n=1 Tax=Zingiber officinale TaxID=94328 RepID=A0A8J5KL02_ZINOF|nr:hypothetical protein ZIOFF_056377 [Zingiber officinale]